jgi:hypothetical protein
MHPAFGWSTPFRILSRFLAISVPSIIIFNIVSLIFSFFATNDLRRLETTEALLKFGSIWNMFLSVYPLLTLFIVSTLPLPPSAPQPEDFGIGPLRTKIAIVVYGSTTLAVGAAVRLAALFNPRPPNTNDVLFSKQVFYSTGFLLEILVVVIYAVSRVDLRFHIPDGSRGPGDYSKAHKIDKQTIRTVKRTDSMAIASESAPEYLEFMDNKSDPSNDELWSKEMAVSEPSKNRKYFEERIDKLGAVYDILSQTQTRVGSDLVFAIVLAEPQRKDKPGALAEPGTLPSRPTPVPPRREMAKQAMRTSWRSARTSFVPSYRQSLRDSQIMPRSLNRTSMVQNWTKSSADEDNLPPLPAPSMQGASISDSDRNMEVQEKRMI